jgi:1,4-alpha-glucan branching enzyme
MNSSSIKNKILDLKNFNLYDPSEILSPVSKDKKISFFANLPLAKKAWIEIGENKLEPIEEETKVFHFEVDSTIDPKEILVCYEEESGYVDKKHHPYAFEPVIRTDQIHSYISDESFRSFEFMGAHVIKFPQCSGVNFSVYAPSAKCVSIIGNFNHWIIGNHPMINQKNTGVWSLFIPDIQEDEIYKFAIRTPSGEIFEKSDPYAYKTELRPRTGSITYKNEFKWSDKLWIKKRFEERVMEEGMSIYEIHLGSWLKVDGISYVSYLNIENKLIPYLKERGFTHVEFLPLMEHPLDDSWGYQVVNYYSPTSRHGNPEGLKHLINALHQNNIGVIIDWVPAHFPKDSHGLAYYDGTHLYEYDDPRKAEHPDWGTYIFDTERKHVLNFLISNADFWIREYHCDGIRIDAVSSMLYLDYSRKPGEWEPNIYGGRENLEAISFLRQMNNHIHKSYPGVLVIAEESTSWPGITRSTESGGLGFDMKWNMGWMHDTLEYFSKDPIYRKYHQNSITFSFWYCFSEKFLLPLSHDEVVYGKRSIFNKMPGDIWQKYANVRLLYSYMYAFPGKKMMFMGDEFAIGEEWNFSKGLLNDAKLNVNMEGVSSLVKHLNNVYAENKFLGNSDFESECFRWIDNSDRENSVIAFMRRDKENKSIIIFIFNFTPEIRNNYRIGSPESGEWNEILNSDSHYYGGSGVGNSGKVLTEDKPWNGFNCSISLTLPPLGALYLIFNKENSGMER